ncbi:hypothetical protein ACIBQ1_50230 [Nonomuraea sp. NPDC050153]|uniref:hypothetical protein n=1 Tax=Nonomuraea sp. NPDC050153 TaxID=3364359 RepID=UPI0037929DBB
MSHLLTIASWEHDGESCKTWTPLEEQHLLRPYQVPELLEPAGIMIGNSDFDAIGPGRAAPIDPVDTALIAALALIEDGHESQTRGLTTRVLYSSGIQQRRLTRSDVVGPHLPPDQRCEPSTS